MRMSGKAVDFVLDFFHQIENKDLNALLEQFDDSARLAFPGLANSRLGFIFGKDKINRILKRFFQVALDLNIEVKNVLATGDRVSAEWTFDGNNKKGRPMRGAGAAFFDLNRASLIEEARIYIASDSFSLK